MTIHIDTYREGDDDDNSDLLVIKLGDPRSNPTEIVIDTTGEEPGAPDIRVKDQNSVTKIALDDEEFSVEDILRNDVSLMNR